MGVNDAGRGRPRVMETIRELVLTKAKENSSWGYTRICGALASMGHEVGSNTVKRILAEHGIEARTREGQTHPVVCQNSADETQSSGKAVEARK